MIFYNMTKKNLQNYQRHKQYAVNTHCRLQLGHCSCNVIGFFLGNTAYVLSLKLSISLILS